MFCPKMKKRLLFLLATVCCVWPAAAQDLIVKRDSSRIEARVTEVSPAEVRYKRFSNPDGPTYVLPVGDIAAIRYANGEEDVFARPETERSAAADSETVGIFDSATIPIASETPDPAVWRYAVGDYYDRGGVRGVVCYVEAEGHRGLIVSLDEAMLAWSLFRKPDLRTIGTADMSDGQRNMETVERYIEANGLSWADFPAFEWCRDKGRGWYLPAINELLALANGYHGGNRMHSDRKARNRFNDMLREHGGKRMDRLVDYFSSTEKDDRQALTTSMEIEPPYVEEIPKNNRFLVRAVHKF